MSYSKPKCEKGSKLMKMRCECKKPAKKKTVKKKTAKKKTAKKRKKKDVYREHWASVRGQYSLNVPTTNQLKVRRKRIDEVYKLYDKIKKLDKKVPAPKTWRYPPEYCHNKQLQDGIKDLKEDLKKKEKEAKANRGNLV
mgnify:CR=1 FL=1|tara:strand:+ start:95 stop:511 length:417 start_codon:yes stop_codon:yes gene_type:complete